MAVEKRLSCRKAAGHPYMSMILQRLPWKSSTPKGMDKERLNILSLIFAVDPYPYAVQALSETL
jgi:hypothetical protein